MHKFVLRAALAAGSVSSWTLLGGAALAGNLWPVNPGYSIGPVLAHAKPGDTVHVEGIHDENVHVPAGVTLEGGPGAAIESSRDPVVQVTGPGVDISGILIASPPEPPGSALLGLIDVSAGDATVIGCSIQGGAIGLSVEGSASATVAACLLTGQSETGILLAGHSTGEVANSRIQPSLAQRKEQLGPLFGLEVKDQATATFPGDHVLGAASASISFWDQASGSVSGAYLKDGMDGISLWGQASPTLSHNTILGNLGSGIIYHQQAGGLAQGNTCEHDRSGIVVQDSAHPTLLGNTCTHNRHVGIAFLAGSGGIARGNTIAHNPTGIFCATASTAVSAGNILQANGPEPGTSPRPTP